MWLVNVATVEGTRSFVLVNVAVYTNPQNSIFMHGNAQIKQQHFSVQKCVKQLVKLKWLNEDTIINIEW